jgi:hypothetical protein
MKRNPYIRSGLERAGFKGGWLEPAQAQADGKEALPETVPKPQTQAEKDAATARALGEAESRAGRANEAQAPKQQPD